jgi:hypothetical protein
MMVQENSKVALDGERLMYLVSELPDTAYSAYQAAAGGDVAEAIPKGSEHLLRTLAHMPAGSSSMELLYIFDHKANGQDKLKLYLCLWSASAEIAQSLDRLIRGGLLSKFYEFKRVEKIPSVKKRLCAGYDIIRREDSIIPLYTRDLNYKIPNHYYNISLFTPNQDNDYMMLDRILDRIDEPVIISIKLQPVDIAKLLHSYTEYLARLDSINHSWDINDESFSDMNYTGPDGHRHISSQNQLNPLSYRDRLASDILRAGREVHKTLLEPNLLFRIQVKAKTQATARLIALALAESGFEEGSYSIVADRKSKDCDPAQNSQEAGAVEQLSGLCRLPVASFSSPLCCRKNTDPPCIDEKDLIFIGYDEQSLTSNGCPIARGIHIDALKKHCSCFGLPGTGKTTSNMNLLYQLYARGIPFMVIECAKKEYPVMKMLKDHKEARFHKLAEELEVYTPGAERVSPFRFNPFEILPGIEIAEHIENLMSCFKASIPVSAGSLPALLGEALEKVYEDYPDPDRPPVMTDLIAAVEVVLAAKGYSGQTRSDMQTAIEVRLGVLAQLTIGCIFRSRHGISIEHLMKVPSVIELDALPDDQACLLVLFIFVFIREYLKTNPIPANGLSYVVLIEEAHVIFGSNNNTPASEEIADTKSSVADLISRMLVELRALGVGIILSDQHPTKLDSAASQSVASKLTFQQVYGPDREELGRSMLFGNTEMQDIARLKPGEAFFITEGYFEPRRIRTPDLSKQLPLFPPPDKQKLLKNICKDKWFQEARTRRISDGLEQLKEHMDKFDDEREIITNKIKRLLGAYNFLLDQKEDRLKKERLAAIVRSLRVLRGKLSSSYSRFKDGPYRRFSYLVDEADSQGSELKVFAESLNRRFESVIKSDKRGLLSVIDKLIKNCNETLVKGG